MEQIISTGVSFYLTMLIIKMRLNMRKYKCALKLAFPMDYISYINNIKFIGGTFWEINETTLLC